MRTQKRILPGEPFVGYTVIPVSDDARRALRALPSTRTVPVAIESFATARRAVTLSTTAAAAVYEAVEPTARHLGVPFPLRFTPVRCTRGQALPFQSIALSAVEILYLVHDGFFDAARGREAAIAAVTACGALPVPVLGLAPVRRGAARAAAERHVDTLIDREAELHRGASADERGSLE